MAEYQGRLFVGTLPSSRVLSIAAGANVTHDRSLSPGWHHVAAQRAGRELKLFVDGKKVATSAPFEPLQFDLSSEAPLRIGFGPTDSFNGQLRDVKLWNRSLSEEDVARESRVK